MSRKRLCVVCHQPLPRLRWWKRLVTVPPLVHDEMCPIAGSYEDALEAIRRARVKNQRSWRRGKFASLVVFAYAGFMLFNPMMTTDYGWLNVTTVASNWAVILMTSLTWPSNTRAYLWFTQQTVLDPMPWPLGPDEGRWHTVEINLSERD